MKKITGANAGRRKLLTNGYWLLAIFSSFQFLPLCANAEIIFQENFENASLNQPYPWNGSNNDNWYDWAYNRALPISNFSEHDRDFLGNNVLYMEEGESYHYISSQTLSVKFNYDLLFHYSDQNPSGYGAIFGQNIIVNQAHPRGGIIGFEMQKDCDSFTGRTDGIYCSELDGDTYRIGDIIPDTWYHVEIIINPAEQMETIKFVNKDTFQEYNLTYKIFTTINSIEGFSLAAHYSPSYCLLDNLLIQTIPEPITCLVVGLGYLFIRRR
jgi:hypothetical protein